ncbi:hypothetical protein HDU89_002689 [Geranomyces variabilis]|nr:hypothetical protein HDU89_002689 [Geranomyces variabilis]
MPSQSSRRAIPLLRRLFAFASSNARPRAATHHASAAIPAPPNGNAAMILAIPAPFLLWLATTTRRPVECSPTFQGVPVAATFLMHQALPRFHRKFPGLELSPVFDMARPEEFGYREEGLFASVMPSTAVVEVPIFEKLSEMEEAKLGGAGIRKSPVGKAVLKGKCSLGCAKVDLVEITVFKMNGDIVWEWKKKGV